MPTTCNIEFENNPMKVVFAGQLLRGTVQLIVANQKNVCGVYVYIHGGASVQWKEGRREVTGNEVYLSQQMYFVGERNGDVQLMPGTYNYTFQYRLPPGLPTNIEGRYGHVRYNIRVVIDRSMWSDKKFKVPFTVVRAVNLNDFPSLRDPVTVEKESKFRPCYACCCVSNANILKMMGRIKVGGYSPGQVINLEINIDNQSDLLIYEINVELIKQINYYKRLNGQTHRYESIMMNKKTVDGCDEHEQKLLAVNIDVPATQPTDHASNLVQVRYLIRVIASTPLFCDKFKLIIPVTIGTHAAGILTQNMYSRMTSAVSSDNVILQQPSVIRLPEESNHFKLTHYTDPPTYADVLRSNGKYSDAEYPNITIAIPPPGEL